MYIKTTCSPYSSSFKSDHLAKIRKFDLCFDLLKTNKIRASVHNTQQLSSEIPQAGFEQAQPSAWPNTPCSLPKVFINLDKCFC